LQECINDCSTTTKETDPRLKNMCNFLFSIQSQDLLQLQIAINVYEEMFPGRHIEYDHSDLVKKIEQEISVSMSITNKALLDRLFNTYTKFGELSQLYVRSLELMSEEKFVDALGFLFYLHREEQFYSSVPSRKPDIIEAISICSARITSIVTKKLNSEHVELGSKIVCLIITLCDKDDPIINIIYSMWKAVDEKKIEDYYTKTKLQDIMRSLKDHKLYLYSGSYFYSNDVYTYKCGHGDPTYVRYTKVKQQFLQKFAEELSLLAAK